MKCPVCLKEVPLMTIYDPNLVIHREPGPLYQVSYPGQKEYVPPRCSDCYDLMMLRREEKRSKRERKKDEISTIMVQQEMLNKMISEEEDRIQHLLNGE